MPLLHAVEVAHLLVSAASSQRHYAADKTIQNKERHRACLRARFSKGSLALLHAPAQHGFGAWGTGAAHVACL